MLKILLAIAAFTFIRLTVDLLIKIMIASIKAAIAIFILIASSIALAIAFS